MRDRRAIAGALLAAVACAGGAWGFVTSEAGCQIQGVCDPSTFYVPALPQGMAAQPPDLEAQGFQSGAGIYAGPYGDLWQSSPMDGTWMNFPAQRTYVIYPQLPDGGPFVGPYTFPQVMISADPNPNSNEGMSNFTTGTGNALELSNLSNLPDGGVSSFQVANTTCTPYFVWVQVAQEGALESTPDASAMADASPDASADASAEAGSD